MPDKELQRLRELRFRANQLLRPLVADLTPFQSANPKLGFRRTSSSTPDRPNDVNVTTTCSCLMALVQFDKVKDFYGPDYKASITDLLQNLVSSPWESSGLIENNAFTTTLVLRCFGFLWQEGYVDRTKALPTKLWSLPEASSPTKDKKRKAASKQIPLDQIARTLAKDINNFSINTYPPASAVVYWFLDGVDRAGFHLGKGWLNLCRFAGDEFRRQQSLVTANHTAMMDPVAMAMAACLCARLLRIYQHFDEPRDNFDLRALPSIIELENSILELFDEQTPTGLWPKYFPLFHYNEAGSNFCYTYELLEAVLLEFGTYENSTLQTDAIISGLERAILSCERGRIETTGKRHGVGEIISYCGWNSGGNLRTLQDGQPESWATAVVHMFLRELSEQLSEHIRQRLLVTYGADQDHSRFPHLDDMLDVVVRIDPVEDSLRRIVRSKLIPTFSDFVGAKAKKLLRKPAPSGALSALLFGPPGTSKTQVAKAIASELQWPLVEIDPSRFLKNTFQNLYIQAEEIFSDVQDMYGVVVLFDELDALVQKRGSATQDTESTFLTTYMLPKLVKLHDQRLLIFLMATNFQENFDDAIKRAGRFDLLLCMGPPSLEEKCNNLSAFLGKGSQVKTGGRLLLKYARESGEIYDKLTLYTYGEFRSLIKGLGDAETILSKLEALGQNAFNELVEQDSKNVGLRLADLELLRSPEFKALYRPSPWKRLKDLYVADFDESEIREKNKNPSPAVRYVLERKRSKFQ